MIKHQIVTLTVNPSIDKSTYFTGLEPEQKIRCERPRFDAGGGGINVSKAIKRLGGDSLCVFTTGGVTGNFLKELVKKEGLDFETIETKSWTRENFIAVDIETNDQYRFGFPGNEITAVENKTIINTIKHLKTDYLVLSGSLNDGLDDDYYGKLVSVANKSGTKVIVDTSGEPLKHVLESGAYLVKPNSVELAKMVGVEKLAINEVAEAAREIIGKGGAEILVVSLGPEGAVIVTKNVFEHVKAPKVEKRTTVGAGDSMVGAMVWALSTHKSIPEVIRWGVACGSAATMNEGTQLFNLKDAEAIFKTL